MTDSRTGSTTVETPGGVNSQAIDIPLILGYTLLAGTMVLGGMVDGAVRLLVSVPLLFFVPGYALLTLLFPSDREIGPAGDPRPVTARWSRGIGWGERTALSVAASLALVAVLGVALTAVGAPLWTAPIVVTQGLVTVVGMTLGGFRRVQLPPDRRLSVPVQRWLDELRAGIWGTPTRFDAALNVVLILAIVAAMSGLAYGLASPDRGEAYTEAALVTRQGDSYVAGGFPTAIRAGDRFPATLSVENHEAHAQAYTLVVRAERVRVDGPRVVVLEAESLLTDRFDVPDGSVRYAETTVRPTLIGTDLRLSYYLFLGDPPETVSAADADEHLYLWIDVRPPTAGTASGSLPG